MSPAPRVSAIVVSYEVREMLRRCLASLAAQGGVDLEIWVVDNASTDGSADMVAAEFGRARLIRNAENRGFARANNQALALASGEFLALVNPDTELPVDALSAAVAAFSRHSGAGAVGPALVNADGSPQPSCHAFPGIGNLLIESTALHVFALRLGIGTPTASPIPSRGEGRVDWVSGACLILSLAAYRAVGGLNEELFMYGEEMDWSWRARGMGFSTVYTDAAHVMHHGGASGAGVRGELFVRNFEARMGFLSRYRGQWRARIAREIMVAGAAGRLAYWRARGALERTRGGVRPWTRDQIERFSAVLAWRRNLGR